MTATAGSHEMSGALMYSPELNVPPWESPFRPNRVGPFKILRVEVTRDDIWVHTTGGTIRIPPAMAGYSWKPAV